MIRRRTIPADRAAARHLGPGPTVDAVLGPLSRQPGWFVLESTTPSHRHGRFTILGCDPVAQFRIIDSAAEPWLPRLQETIGPPNPGWSVPNLPLAGGWVGYITYEAGLTAFPNVRAKPRELDIPDVQFALYDTVALYDHTRHRWSVAGVELDRRRPLLPRLDTLAAMIDSAPDAPALDLDSDLCDRLIPDISRDHYAQQVRTALRYIEAGDVYQVNLTQRFTAATSANALQIYRRVRRANPSPLSALLHVDESAVISASPELFLHLADGVLQSRPIKGTRPRTGDTAEDRAQAADLVTSAKDLAELNMIIDLVRNDLGKVSRFGTVTVESDGDLEAHPTVFHRVATVQGRLRPDCGWAEALQACYPGGSVTGAPKRRALQIIDELETTRRDVYCGALGYIALDGSLCLNLPIRTMLLDRERISLYGGGGIVADSDPDREYEEIIAKITGLRRALRPSEACIPQPV